MKKQTRIKVIFAIISNKKLNFDDMTQRLKVEPTAQRIEHIRNQDTIETNYVWEYATAKIETLDAKEVFSQITDRFMRKEHILKEIKQEYDAFSTCDVVVEIEHGQAPALYIDKETLRFFSAIETELDIDLYVMS